MKGEREGQREGGWRKERGGRKDFPGSPTSVSPAPILHTFTN